MADSLVDSTIVENLIAGLLVSGPDKVEPAIKVYIASEAPPSAYADKAGDTPVARWCRLNPIKLDPLRRRNQGGDGDQQSFVLAITVGVSDEELRTAPARLNESAHLIAAALDGAYSGHSATTHHVQIERARRDTTIDGSHQASHTAVVMVSGIALRESGRTASLTS